MIALGILSLVGPGAAVVLIAAEAVDAFSAVVPIVTGGIGAIVFGVIGDEDDKQQEKKDPPERQPAEPHPKSGAPQTFVNPEAPIYILNDKTGQYDQQGTTDHPENYPTLPPGSILSGH